MPFSKYLPVVIGYGAKLFVNKIRHALILCLVFFSLTQIARTEPVKIVVIGDSLVHGYGLVQEAGFVPQLERWLTREGLDVSLVNAGVSGDTTSGGLARIDWTLGADIDALVVSLGGNDVLRGINPSLSRSNLDGILSRAGDAGLPVLLVGIAAPGNFGTDYKASFDAIFPELAEKYGVLLYPNFLQALAEMPDRANVLTRFFQADNIHPNQQGVALIVNDIGPSVATLVAQVRAR